MQFDAHADLREEFEGTPYSHASVMKRIVDAGVPTLAVGIRSLSAPEARVIRERGLPVIWGHQLDRAEELFPPMLAALPEKIYLTFDIDYFDPSLVPATGTPEPGGGHWYPTLRLLRHLFQTKTVVAMDLIELAPIGGHPASDFLAAKLIYKCLGYLWEKKSGGAPSALSASNQRPSATKGCRETWTPGAARSLFVPDARRSPVPGIRIRSCVCQAAEVEVQRAAFPRP